MERNKKLWQLRDKSVKVYVKTGWLGEDSGTGSKCNILEMLVKNLVDLWKCERTRGVS